MNKERELEALAEVLLILTKEFVENPTVAIKDAFRYVLREIVTPILASETAYWDFYNKTGKDIQSIDWRESRTINTKNGDYSPFFVFYSSKNAIALRYFSLLARSFSVILSNLVISEFHGIENL